MKKEEFILDGENIGFIDDDEIVITDENVIEETLEDMKN